MNTKLFLCAGLATGLALQVCPTAMAQNDYSIGSGTLDTIIPDNNLSGIASQLDVTASGMIDTVTLTMTLAGVPNANDAYNGDYYAYLQFGSGLDVLLNRIDTGTGNNPGSGMTVTFTDSASVNIENATQTPGVALTGSYQPASSLNGTFAGMTSPNGEWTLFIADESPGGVGELVSWDLAMTVPDNGSTLILLGVGFLGLCGLRHYRMASVSRG